MLLVQSIPVTAFRLWGHDVAEPETKLMLITNLASGESSQDTDSWIEIEREAIKTPKFGCSTPAPASPGGQDSESTAALTYDTPISGPAYNGTIFSNESHELDTTTFPSHAVHLLPSEPNGTWRTRVSYAVGNPSESAPTLRDVVKDHVPELDVPILYHMLKEVAQDRKDDVERWINRTLADQDLVEIHNHIRRMVSMPSLPNLRQIDHVVDTVTEIAQSLRKRRSESELLEKTRDNKFLFAEVLCRKAQRALIEQGICKTWQLQCERYVQLQNAMQAALLQTFIRIQQAQTNVPLYRARPQWVAQRGTKAWRLELDVGVVGVEVGLVTDRSLIELGFIDTGFELLESCGCAPITDIDRRVQGVEDEWQLLES